MRCRMCSTTARGVAAAAMVIAAAQAQAMVCAMDPAPAATVLVPYVEADVANCAVSSLRTTRVSLLNPTPTPVLVHVTLWSDAAVPVLNFDVYLAGQVVESLDLRQILCDGDLPSTGSAVSPVGTLADPPAAFPLCNDTTDPNNGQPVYPPGVVPPTLRASLRAALTGQFATVFGGCVGFAHGDNVARGYLTVDAVDQCSVLFPSDPGYSTILADDNAVVADVVMVSASGIETAIEAVPLEADPTVFSAGDTTFYGRYNGLSADDAREPLPTTFSSGFRQGDRLIVWRETSSSTAAFTCGTLPPWYPLGAVNGSGAGPLFAMTAGGAIVPLPSDSFPLATQLVGSNELPLPQTLRGRLYANLQSGATARPSPAGQAWVQVLSGTGAVADAAALDSSCDAAAFVWTSPGPTMSP